MLKSVIKHNALDDKYLQELFTPLFAQSKLSKDSLLILILDSNPPSKKLLKSFFNDDFEILNNILARILGLRDSELTIATLNNLTVLNILESDQELRNAVFNMLDGEKKDFLDILEEAKPKIIERAKKKLEESQDDLHRRRLRH